MRYLILLAIFLLPGCKLSSFKSACSPDPCGARLQNLSRKWQPDTLNQFRSVMTGYVENSGLGNHQAISVDTEKRELVLSLSAPKLFQNWVRPIPELPGANLTAVVNSMEQSFLLLHYPIYLLISGFENFGVPTGLPNGKTIPGVSNGKLHNIKIVLDEFHQSHIYFDKGVVGLLLDTPYDPETTRTAPIKGSLFNNVPGNILGFINTYPCDYNKPGGIFLSGIVPDPLLQKLEKDK